VATHAPLSRQASLDLLGSVPFGRVVFSQRALPAIRPVNHAVDGGEIIIRTDLGSALSVETTLSGGIVVAYEADAIDAATRTGWSVVVTGAATTVTDADEIARYERLLQPWVDGAKDWVIRISVDLITGQRLVPPTGEGRTSSPTVRSSPR
jgi:hypothetical protein